MEMSAFCGYNGISKFKVAEHSFHACFCWCNSARAQGLQKTNMPSIEQSLYLLNIRSICVLMALVFC